MATERDKLYDVQIKTQEVAGIMHKNIDTVIQRGENIDRLQEKSEDLELHATKFKKLTTAVKNKFCCENAKLWGFIIGFVILAIGIILLIALV